VRETTLGILFRLYINALLKGNPFVLVPTLVVAAALGAGPFSQALSSRDPVAIGVAVIIALGILFVLGIAIIDRKLNPPSKKNPSSTRSSRR
jgi:hypothetical protein